MTKGRVIKNYNGYYYVDVGRDNLVECGVGANCSSRKF